MGAKTPWVFGLLFSGAGITKRLSCLFFLTHKQRGPQLQEARSHPNISLLAFRVLHRFGPSGSSPFLLVGASLLDPVFSFLGFGSAHFK